MEEHDKLEWSYENIRRLVQNIFLLRWHQRSATWRQEIQFRILECVHEWKQKDEAANNKNNNLFIEIVCQLVSAGHSDIGFESETTPCLPCQRGGNITAVYQSREAAEQFGVLYRTFASVPFPNDPAAAQVRAEECVVHLAVDVFLRKYILQSTFSEIVPAHRIQHLHILSPHFDQMAHHFPEGLKADWALHHLDESAGHIYCSAWRQTASLETE